MDSSKNKFGPIADEIENRIDRGEYPVDSKLPPQRDLASEFQTTPVTISKAIKELIGRNRIQSVKGSGTFVRSETFLKDVIRAGATDSEFNFSILQPCLIENITDLRDALSAQAKAFSNPQLFAYSEHSGLMSHREAGVTWVKQWGLAECDPEDIFLVNGAQQALSVLIQMNTDANDVVLVEDKTYPGLLAILNYLGRKAVPVAMDEQGILPEALKEQITQFNAKMLIVTPTMQNPTTAVMSTERRQSIAQVINQCQLLTVEDDIYAFLNDQPLPCLADLSPDHVFYVTSLSKSISPGLRVGYIRSPKSFVKKLDNFLRALNWLPPPLVFDLASHLINTGKSTTMAMRQKEIARSRQALCTQYLGDFSFDAKPTSYQIWLDIPEQWSMESFILNANERRILLSSASFFSPSGASSRKVRVSLMAINETDVFEEGLSQLKQLLEGSADFSMF